MVQPPPPTIEQVIATLTAPDGQFPTCEQQIRGNTYRVFQNAPANLRDMFAYCLQHGPKDFVVYDGERLSFAETHRRAARLANALIEQYGIAKGDRIAIAMRNLPEWIIAYMAVTSSGAVAVPMNAWWVTEELAFGLDDSGARLVIADRERLERILPLRADRDIKLILARADGLPPEGVADLDAVIAGGSSDTMPEVAIEPDDDLSIMYTSGSTGYPKGAVSTHRGVISVVMNWVVMGIAVQILDGTFGQEPVDQPSALVAIPLFHVTACNALFLLSVIPGRKLVLMHKWDVGKALQLIEAERITTFNSVPTQTFELLTAPNRGDYRLDSLMDLGAGGAARPPDHVARLKAAFPTSRPNMGYGLTETNAIGAVNGRDEYLGRPASVGKASAPMAEIKIIDNQGNDLPSGERGEICIKSAANVRGYWNRPDDTAAAFVDGWLHTGDVGYLDDEGYLFIVDRIKNVIIRGGENVAGLEVEAVLHAHEAVAEVAVFGLPDERLGETVAAVIQVTPGRSLDAAGLTAYAGEHLAAFKVPSRIWFQDTPLPRIASGKIDRRGLQAQFLERGEKEPA